MCAATAPTVTPSLSSALSSGQGLCRSASFRVPKNSIISESWLSAFAISRVPRSLIQMPPYSFSFVAATVYRDNMSMSIQYVFYFVVVYTEVVPNLWNETIEAHRAAVREAILDTAMVLVSEHGLRSVTMSRIAEKTGIGRATLYKYFPDVEAILLAWHERQITGHLEYLAEVRDRTGDAGEQLEAVLEAYALISHERYSPEHPGPELAALLHLHRGVHVTGAQQQVHDMIKNLLTEAAETGDVRGDIEPEELASYCLHALAAASSLPSKAAVRRLVTVTLAGLRPPSSPSS